MSVLRLMMREMVHRKLHLVLGLSAITIAVAVFVSVLTLSGALEQETIRLMRDMGFNLLIVPKETDMLDFWSNDFASADMPERYVHELAESKVMTVQHLCASLSRKITWRGRTVLLKGALKETPLKHRKPKTAILAEIPAGKVWVGHELARGFDLQTGNTIDVLGKSFEIVRCLEEQGDMVDITIFGSLRDVQEVLEMAGRINMIEALECNCESPDRLGDVRAEIGRILPDTQVSERASIAVARAETRNMVEGYGLVIVPLVLGAASVWIGLLALGNVHQRRPEIGTLRAVGWGSGRIAMLFLGKAVFLGLVGAGLGFFLGTLAALRSGPDLFHLTADNIQPLYDILGWSLVGAPALCALATYLPAMVAVAQDPAAILVKE